MSESKSGIESKLETHDCNQYDGDGVDVDDGYCEDDEEASDDDDDDDGCYENAYDAEDDADNDQHYHG